MNAGREGPDLSRLVTKAEAERRRRATMRHPEPTTAEEALDDIHRRYCATDAHDPVCRILHERLGITDEDQL